MTLDSLRRLLLSKPGAVEDHPFGPEPHVFKVGGYSLRRVARENRPAVLLALSGFGWLAV